MNLSLLIYVYLALFQPVDETPIMLMVAIQHFCYGFGLLALVFYILQEIAPRKY
jgi:PAT family beta-lactamase induction signal transducer AmpG